MKAIRELKRELPLLYNRRKVEPRDVIYIFGKVREILENDRKLKEIHTELNLFCNWCMHSKLSNSKTVYRALITISKEFARASIRKTDENGEDTTNKAINACANILNIPKLRQSLKTVLEGNRINSTITNNKDWWDAFLKLLFKEISEKPISFPQSVLDGADTSSKNFRLYQEILTLPNTNNFDKIISLEVNLEESSFLFSGKTKKGFTYHLMSLAGVTFVVASHGKEDISAFN